MKAGPASHGSRGRRTRKRPSIHGVALSSAEQLESIATGHRQGSIDRGQRNPRYLVTSLEPQGWTAPALYRAAVLCAWRYGEPDQAATWKAAGHDCLTKEESIKPCTPLHVAYEVGAARQQTVRSPRTMNPHSQAWHQNREATVYLPA